MCAWLGNIKVEWLADSDFDIRSLAYIAVLLLLSVVGGILQQQKKKKEERPRPQPGARPPQRRPGQPARARPAQPPIARAPQPPRPARPARPPRRAPDPVEALLRDVYTPDELRRAQGERRVAPPPTPDTVKALEPQPRPTAAAARREPLREPVLRAQLQRMVRQRSQLRAAILMSEILGPPLALREDRPR